MKRTSKRVSRRVSTRTKPAASKALARPGDPLVLADGRVVEPDRMGVAKEAHDLANESKLSSATFRPQVRRAARDMPARGNPLKLISCVLVCSIMGMTDRDIADELEVDVSHIKRVRQHAAYEECFNTLLGEFINSNSDMLQSRIAAYGAHALTEVANIALGGKEEKNRLRASEGLLDRNGTLGGSLKIGQKQHALHITIEKVDNAESGVKVALNGETVMEDMNA